MKIITIILIGIYFFASSITAFAATRVSVSPSSVTLSEDDANQIFTIALDEPIITMEEEGYVTVSLSVDDGRVTLSTSSVTFMASEWNQTQTFSVDTVGDSVVNTDNTAIITMLVDSNSEYYNGFQNTITITLTDDDSQTNTSRRKGSIKYGCKDLNATNYNRFSASKPSLCVYAQTQAPTQTPNGASVTQQGFMNMQPEIIRVLQTFLIKQSSGEAAIMLARYGATGYFGPITQAAFLEYKKASDIIN